MGRDFIAGAVENDKFPAATMRQIEGRRGEDASQKLFWKKCKIQKGDWEQEATLDDDGDGGALLLAHVPHAETKKNGTAGG
jgi:hypothetical protein